MTAPIDLRTLLLTARRSPPVLGTGTAWTPNLKDGTAVHESGLVVKFQQLPMAQGEALDGHAAVDLCWMPPGYPVWAVLVGDALFEATLRASEVADARTARWMLRSLTQDAGAAWIHAILQREQQGERRGLGLEAHAGAGQARSDVAALT